MTDTLETLQDAAARWKSGGAKRTLEFLPPADAAAIARLEAEVGKVPPEIARLLALASGFRASVGSVEFEVAFDGTEAGLEDAFPKCVPLMSDMCGNDWRVDVNPVTGEWGRVYYVCHDPAVIILQAENLGGFLQRLLAEPGKGSPDPREAMTYDATVEASKRSPFVMPAAEAERSSDARIAAAARGLKPGSFIADLRSATQGQGFEYGVLGPWADIGRPGPEPVWTIQPGPRRGCWAFLFGG